MPFQPLTNSVKALKERDESQTLVCSSATIKTSLAQRKQMVIKTEIIANIFNRYKYK